MLMFALRCGVFVGFSLITADFQAFLTLKALLCLFCVCIILYLQFINGGHLKIESIDLPVGFRSNYTNVMEPNPLRDKGFICSVLGHTYIFFFFFFFLFSKVVYKMAFIHKWRFNYVIQLHSLAWKPYLTWLLQTFFFLFFFSVRNILYFPVYFERYQEPQCGLLVSCISAVPGCRTETSLVMLHGLHYLQLCTETLEKAVTFTNACLVIW